MCIPTQNLGPNRFSRFDVYWIQTDQTDRHPVRQAKYIYRSLTIVDIRLLKFWVM